MKGGELDKIILFYWDVWEQILVYLKIHFGNVYHYSVLKGGLGQHHIIFFILLGYVWEHTLYLEYVSSDFIFCRSLLVLLLLAFVLCVHIRFTDSGYLQTLLSSLHIFLISQWNKSLHHDEWFFDCSFTLNTRPTS